MFTMLCPDCHGQRTIFCSSCSGSGKHFSTGVQIGTCKECDGTGKRRCDACGGTGEAEISQHVWSSLR